MLVVAADFCASSALSQRQRTSTLILATEQHFTLTNVLGCYIIECTKHEGAYMQNIIHLLVGVAGSGKTTYAKQNLSSAKYFSPDDYRMSMYGRLRQDKNNEVFDAMHRDMTDYLQENSGVELVYDATNINRTRRAELYQRFSGLAKMVIHFFAIDYGTIRRQNQERTGEKRVPDRVTRKMYTNLQVPRYKVDYDELVVIGEFEKFKPEFAQDIPHDSPYHAESMFEHFDMAKELSEREPDAERMYELAEFHDLGKFMARVPNKKNTRHANYFRSVNNGQFFHYTGHPNISAFYYLAYINELVDLNDHDNPETKEKLENLEVIYQHMQAHDGFSQKMIKKNLLSETELDVLMRFEKIDSEARYVDEEIYAKYMDLMKGKN